LIEIEIDDEAWMSVTDVEDLVEEAARLALEEAGVVTVSLTDDETVADLNQRFRGKTGPTNVLSFPAAETARPFLGDVILAYGVCTREADEQGKPIADHLLHLVIHGVLHLLGHDHLEDDEAEAMEARERTLLAKLGVPDPYAVSR
jgi:probable rRNA maturation factor